MITAYIGQWLFFLLTKIAEEEDMIPVPVLKSASQLDPCEREAIQEDLKQGSYVLRLLI